MAPVAVNGAGDAPGKQPEDTILPPKNIRQVLEKSAGFVVRRGNDYEQRIIQTVGKEHQMQFILPDNPYHSYYQWRKKEIAEGRGYADDDGTVPGAAVKKAKTGPVAPPEFQFSARMPTISAVDLEIVKLTALFVAVKGSGWMTRFTQNYGQNPQFQFLRPQHSFHPFFTRLIDQYRELLNPDNAGLAERQKARLEELEQNITDKYKVLDRAKQRAEWVKYQETQKVQKEEAEEKEKLEYAQIDWHDFAVVGTIEFTEADEQVDLPPPQSKNDLQSLSLEQKAGLEAPVGMRLEEAMPEDMEFFGVLPQQPPPPPPSQYAPQMPPAPIPQSFSPSPYVPAQASTAVDAQRIAERTAEADRAAAARAAATGQGPMRIKDDYVPRAQARRQNVTTYPCPICKQQIAASEFDEHVRIEQLDPRWREQTRIAQQRSSTTNLSTADVANNLKRLASQRSDVFDPVTGREIGGRDVKRVEIQQGGEVSAQLPPAPGAVGAAAQRPTDVQEQLRLLQSKYGNQG